MLNEWAMDRRKGALYGQAIGDALGAPFEFAKPKMPTPFTYVDTTELISEADEQGGWTDDTAQALALARALTRTLQAPDLSISQEIARELLDWYKQDGRGCGLLTRAVLTSPNYSLTPIAEAKSYWEKHKGYSAPNGGVMRTVGVPIVKPWDIFWVIDKAALACSATHYDSRCVASAVAISTLIAHLIQNRYSVQVILKTAEEAGSAFNSTLLDYSQRTLSGLQLADPHEQGYTYKCMGCGFWALREFYSQSIKEMTVDKGKIFRSLLQKVVAVGGDTDTNAAVAGAILGSHIGFSQLPKDLIQGLKRKEALEAILVDLPSDLFSQE